MASFFFLVHIQIVDDHTKIYKATNSDVDSYSAFFDNNHVSQTKLAAELRSRRITDVYVCGIAADYCVKFTALDAAELGFRTAVIGDGIMGSSEEGSKKAKEALTEAGCLYIQSSQVQAIIVLGVANELLQFS